MFQRYRSLFSFILLFVHRSIFEQTTRVENKWKMRSNVQCIVAHKMTRTDCRTRVMGVLHLASLPKLTKERESNGVARSMKWPMAKWRARANRAISAA